MTAGGDRLAERYLLVRPLGRGGMAEVWEARDQVLGRRVAVKVFRQDGDAAEADRAVAEMRTLAALSHPNLVTVYDAGTDGASTFLVMELVSGSTLADRIGRGVLDAATVAVVGAQVAAGLAYIHRRGIVHRDVKPANILLPVRDHDDAPVAQLVDFGIAHQVGQERLTTVGMTVGTARYLAPEQVTGGTVTAAADVYALGLVLLEALGRAPDWTGTPIEIATARLTRPPQVPADLGPTWTPLLGAMVAADPAARPSAGDVRAALEGRNVPEPTRELPPPPTVLLPAQGAAPVRRRRGVLVGALAVGACAVVAAVGFAVASGSGDDAPGGAGTSAPPAAATSPATAPSSAASSAAATSPVAATSPATSAAPTAASTADAPTTPAGPGGGGAGPGGGGPGGPGQGGMPPGKTKTKGGKDKP